MTITLQQHYASLGRQFALPTLPEKVTKPAVLLWNQALAEKLGLNLTSDEQALYFSGQKLFQGSQPVAMTYAGHQFGHFNPQLGDGRAHLLGEITHSAGLIQELHLKGSGRTPFSRNGDGKCAIKPAIREYIMSEAMHALGVPSCRTLAVVATHEPLFRQQQTTGAIVTRVAQSHLRVGTFEFFAARGMMHEVGQLADLCIQRHYPEIEIEDPRKYINLLSDVIDKQITLLTEWMRVGFIHGVMNTDNTLLSGHTIDYGPCAMLEVYHPATVYSSIDEQGRYAFGNQPNIAQWNLTRFAECLVPLIDSNQDKAIEQVMPLLAGFSAKFNASYNRMMGKKLGFNNSNQSIEEHSNKLLNLMQKHQLDFTRTFHKLTQSLSTDLSLDQALNDWHQGWLSLLQEAGQTHQQAQQIMQANNPLVIPRNHHVEMILNEVESTLDGSKALEFLEVLKTPYAMSKHTAKYQDNNPEFNKSYQTFCGT